MVMAWTVQSDESIGILERTKDSRAFKLKNLRARLIARAILVARAILTFNKLGVFTVFPALFLVVPLGKQTWRPK
jgi:hypothetical protein